VTVLKLILALIAVESGGDNFARGRADELGCLQIRPIVVRDLRRLGYRFTLADRTDRAKSIEMCQFYLAHYATAELLGHEPTDEDRARIWNGGPDGWGELHTKKYWHKVQLNL
jgi:soluble lytic murein transglycosylase-like protein